MDVSALVSLGIAVLGIAGLIFTALRYQRDDTTAIVNQQAAITTEMATLNNELRQTSPASGRSATRWPSRWSS